MDRAWLPADEIEELGFFRSGTFSKYIRFGAKPGTSITQIQVRTYRDQIRQTNTDTYIVHRVLPAISANVQGIGLGPLSFQV